MGRSNREVVEAFLAAGQTGDLEAQAALLHEDIVMEWPQSGERFSGRANAAAAMRALEVRPEAAGEGRMVGSGDVWVVMMSLRYGEDIYHYVGVLELELGTIRRGTGYFSAPFPAQPSRAMYADPPGRE
jgi:SnoaL-like domain